MARHRVLLVEPNLELGQILREYLTRADLEVFEAADGTAALETSRRERPDVVAIEETLPEPTTALSVVRAIKAETDLPVLLLTSRGAPESRLEALDAGADDYLLKPFAMRELSFRCERLISLHHANQPGELSGDLSRFKSTDILQMLEANQATGVLRVDGEEKGEIHLLDGYICGCFAGEAQGEEAAYRLIPVRKGRFHFVRSNIRSNVKNLRSTTEFMMEALRRHDERAKQAAS